MQKEKYKLNPSSVRKYTTLFKQLNIPYTAVITNYTTKLITTQREIFFVKNRQSPKMFIAAQMIKKDIEGKKIEAVNKFSLKYYSVNQNIFDDFVFSVGNIDISAAYPTVLLSNNLITEKTFNYLMTLEKLERLAAIGMLAGRKNIFTYNSAGKLISYEKDISPTENYFWFCVFEVWRIMEKIKNIIGDKFIFSWVDAIYFKQCDEARFFIEDYLTTYGYKFKYEYFNTCDIKFNKLYHQIILNQTHPDYPNGKNKIFNLPANISDAGLIISQFLNNQFEEKTPDKKDALIELSKKITTPGYYPKPILRVKTLDFPVLTKIYTQKLIDFE